MRKSVALIWSAVLVWGLYFTDIVSKKSSLELKETKKDLQGLIDNKVNECVYIFKDAITLYILWENTKYISNRKLSENEIKKLDEIVNYNLKKKEELVKEICSESYKVFQKIIDTYDK